LKVDHSGREEIAKTPGEEKRDSKKNLMDRGQNSVGKGGVMPEGGGQDRGELERERKEIHRSGTTGPAKKVSR